MNVGELFVSLGFDVDSQKLKDFESGVKSLENHLLSLGAVATGSVIGLDVFLGKVADRATAMKQFGDQTGYSTQALQEWALVIHRTNPLIDIEAAQEKYKAFTEYVKNINWGAGGGAILSQLGVNYIPGADPAQYLAQLSEKLPGFIAHFGRARAGMLLDQIGIGAGSIDALLTTAQQRKGMTAGLVNSEEQNKNLDELNSKMAVLGDHWRKFESDVASDWTKPAEEQINRLMHFIDGLNPAIKEITKSFGQWKIAGETLLVLFGAPWAIAMVGVAARLAPVTAAVYALVWAINDLNSAMHGLPSVSRPIIKNFVPGLKTWLNDPGKAFENLGAAIDIPMKRWGVDQFLNGGKSVTVNNSVTQNIHSTADPGEVAAESKRLMNDWFQSQHLDPTSAGINLGVPY